VVKRQAFVQVPPAQLFGPDAVALHGRLDHVLLVQSHDHEDVTTERIDGATVASAMRPSLEDERRPLLELHRQFRFLFPDRRCPAVDDAAGAERELLDRYLRERTAHVLRHPYPMRVASLAGPVESVLAGAG
jgi:hypothetical protein